MLPELWVSTVVVVFDIQRENDPLVFDFANHVFNVERAAHAVKDVLTGVSDAVPDL